MFDHIISDTECLYLLAINGSTYSFSFAKFNRLLHTAAIANAKWLEKSVDNYMFASLLFSELNVPIVALQDVIYLPKTLMKA